MKGYRMMLRIKNEIAEAIGNTISKVFSADIPAAELAAMFEYPPDSTMGDLALPCFKLSRTLRRPPAAIAGMISDSLPLGGYIGSSAAVNGFLNIKLDTAATAAFVIGDILQKGEDYGRSDIGSGKTVVLDYSSPNVAKPFHIGHLGTTVIGHSIKLLHQFCGYSCIGINYLGDWGTQFGKLITAYRKWGSEEAVETRGIDELVDLYVRVNNAISGNEEKGIPPDNALADEARAEFCKMEQGDEENLRLWKWFIDISLREYRKTYDQLGITFEYYSGESKYAGRSHEMIDALSQRGLLTVDNGATMVSLDKYGMPPFLVLKSDGSTLYSIRDVAAAMDRMEKYDFDKCIYVTSSGQSLHFAQLFKVIELMGLPWYDRLVHVPYGTVSINGEKLATRTGNVVLLKDLFKMATDKVLGVIAEKSPDLPDREATAEAVGIGAVVFHYLLGGRIKDTNFILEDALSFDGSTGPYVQYTYARTRSILERASGIMPSPVPVCATAPSEDALVRVLARFPEAVLSALEGYEPSVITRYALDAASAFNLFYHECRITDAGDAAPFRLALTKAAGTVISSALHLICIKTPEKI